MRVGPSGLASSMTRLFYAQSSLHAAARAQLPCAATRRKSERNRGDARSARTRVQNPRVATGSRKAEGPAAEREARAAVVVAVRRVGTEAGLDHALCVGGEGDRAAVAQHQVPALGVEVVHGG